MLLYRIISNITDSNNTKSDNKSGRKVKAKPKVIRDLLKNTDEEYKRTVLRKERQSLSRSRSFN